MLSPDAVAAAESVARKDPARMVLAGWELDRKRGFCWSEVGLLYELRWRGSKITALGIRSRGGLSLYRVIGNARGRGNNVWRFHCDMEAANHYISHGSKTVPGAATGNLHKCSALPASPFSLASLIAPSDIPFRVDIPIQQTAKPAFGARTYPI